MTAPFAVEWIDDRGVVIHSAPYDIRSEASSRYTRESKILETAGFADVSSVRMVDAEGSVLLPAPPKERGSIVDKIETGTPEFNDLMRKLAQIQELIDRGATQGEIEAATGRMQALLTKHALEYHLVADHIRGAGPEPEIIKNGIEMPRATWSYNLMFCIAINNFGKAIRLDVHGKGPGRMIVVATRENFIAIKAMYEFLWPVIDKLAYIEYDAAVRNARTYGMSQRKWGYSFRIGAVDGIAKAMRDARQTTANESDAWGLVVVEDAKVNDKYAELFPNAVAIKGPKIVTEAYKRGVDVGGSIHLGKQVGTSSAKAIGR